MQTITRHDAVQLCAAANRSSAAIAAKYHPELMSRVFAMSAPAAPPVPPPPAMSRQHALALSYAKMSYVERHDLAESNPDLFNEARTAWLAEGGVQ
jgi:hypothetical protein